MLYIPISLQKLNVHYKLKPSNIVIEKKSFEENSKITNSREMIFKEEIILE